MNERDLQRGVFYGLVREIKKVGVRIVEMYNTQNCQFIKNNITNIKRKISVKYLIKTSTFCNFYFYTVIQQ